MRVSNRIVPPSKHYHECCSDQERPTKRLCANAFCATPLFFGMYIYIYIYTHTLHIYIYIYIFVCMNPPCLHTPLRNSTRLYSHPILSHFSPWLVSHSRVHSTLTIMVILILITIKITTNHEHNHVPALRERFFAPTEHPMFAKDPNLDLTRQ